MVALPLGTLVAHRDHLRGPVLSALGIGRVVPSLAVLTLMIPFFGIGFRPAVVALALLAIPPIAINTDLGFRSVSRAALDAAQGLGMTQTQIRNRVETPLALPIIFAGLRTASIEVIASATLAAFIGGGGLGEYITSGLQNSDGKLLLLGGASVAVLALLVESILGLIARQMGEFQ